jgi:hypothetical protein
MWTSAATANTMVPVGRETSDETYVLDLCDEILGEPGQRQARFGWLLGHPGRDGRVRTPPWRHQSDL